MNVRGFIRALLRSISEVYANLFVRLTAIRAEQIQNGENKHKATRKQHCSAESKELVAKSAQDRTNGLTNTKRCIENSTQ